MLLVALVSVLAIGLVAAVSEFRKSFMRNGEDSAEVIKPNIELQLEFCKNAKPAIRLVWPQR